MLLRNLFFVLWAGGLTANVFLMSTLPWRQYERLHETTFCIWAVSGMLVCLLVGAQYLCMQTYITKCHDHDAASLIDWLTLFRLDAVADRSGSDRYPPSAAHLSRVKSALVAALRTVQYGDRLSILQLRWLHKVLEDGTDSDLIISVLEALPKVGNKSSLKPVQCLIDRCGSANEEQKVRDAAQTCLERLEKNLSERSSCNILLRASKSPTADHGELLHPAQSKPDASHATLMRAAERPEEN